jgi:hypothetical protein
MQRLLTIAAVALAGAEAIKLYPIGDFGYSLAQTKAKTE